MGMISEFKDFAIIMGGAFGTVIKSLIDDVVMPVVGHFTGGADFSALKIPLSSEEGSAAIGYGLFINALIAFLILAFVLYLMIKGMNAAKKAEAEAPEAPPANEVLLAEIRDLLKK